MVAHSLGGYVHTFAYSFHMPLFFLVTGYFCKPKPILASIRGDFTRLFVPFFFTALVMLLVSLALSPFAIEGVKSPSYIFEALIYGNGSSVNHHKLWGDWSVVGSVWFLPALFWAKTTYNILLQYNSKYIPWIVMAIGGLAAICRSICLVAIFHASGGDSCAVSDDWPLCQTDGRNGRSKS